MFYDISTSNLMNW